MCLFLDPGLFRTSGFTIGMLQSIALFSYGVVAMSMLALVHALVVGMSPPILRGMLFGGALFASAIALVVVPISLLLLAAGIMAALNGELEPTLAFGPAGLTAAGTAVVYWRYFVVANKPTKGSSVVASLVGTAAILVAPAAANVSVRSVAARCMSRVMAAPGGASESDVRCLRRLAFTTDLAPFGFAYERAEAGDQVALAKVYFEITGRDLARDSILSAD